MLHDMDVSGIVKAIDERIEALQQAKSLLGATAVPSAERHARQAVASQKAAETKSGKSPAKQSTGRKPMSAEGRARIAAAQKKRWALQHAEAAAPAKKVAAKKAPAKKSAAKKAAAAKQTGTANKTAAKKVAAGTKAAAAKKTPAKKSPAKKSPAKKTASVKQAAADTGRSTVESPAVETTAS